MTGINLANIDLDLDLDLLRKQCYTSQSRRK